MPLPLLEEKFKELVASELPYPILTYKIADYFNVSVPAATVRFFKSGFTASGI